MTRKGRSRSGGANQYRRAERQPTAKSLAIAKSVALANPYTVLSTAPIEEDEEEMNAHLFERFNGSHATRGDESPRYTPAEKPNPAIREYFAEPNIPIIGGAWLNKPEIPTPSEIMPNPVNYPTNLKGKAKAAAQIIDVTADIRPNKAEGAYESNEDYLGTQYDLLREDAVRPLREAVEQVRDSPYLDEYEYKGSVGVYEPVYIKSVVFSPRGLATRVAFSLGRVKKYVRWAQSKRLITGTLVALTPADDCFQTKCVLATVAARPIAALEQNPPEIDLFFARTEDLEIDPMRKWVMVEARSSFFEASRYTMLALQHMMREPFPLSEHLVDAQQHVEPPVYLQDNPYTDMSSLVAMDEGDSFRNVNILEQWPDSKSTGLDKSQSQATKRIMTKRLAIVQGPPGTGKTYVSVVSLKMLLDKLGAGDPPIIVACQTNHAVDQILRHAAEFEPKFARLGGRTKDKEVIKSRTLYELRNSVSQPRAPGSLKQQAIVAMKKLTTAMQMLLVPLEANKPPLNHHILVKNGLLTEKQAESLESMSAMGVSADTYGVHMEQWLGKYLIPCDHPLQPEDFGFEYEEEDFEVEQLQELEAEAALADDDFDTLPGARTLLNDNVTGKIGSFKSDEEIRQLLRKTDDLYAISVRERGAIYNYFQREIKRIIRDEFRKAAKEYERIVPQRKIGHWEQDLKILRSQRLIGMTTTGLSKYRGLLAALNPKIILIEEAAETLEAPVTAACLPSLEHLILVGDHQQLRPHCQVKDLEDEPYYFNLSLFERLVLNKAEVDCLTRQRRMIPEVRRLLQPIYGKVLRDHPSVTDVKNRPPVEGMGGCNSYFFTHEWPESCDGNKSALNEEEAKMIVGFFDYLVLNGVDPSKITVLTFYNGQRKTIHKKLQLHPNLRAIPSFNVVTVDSYQGEENDIVLLSLVRSNKRRIIGFLDVDNRVCVALSRAKRGFYIFGNAEMLAIQSAIWADVVEIMMGKKEASDPNKRRHVGYRLPLQCSKHNNKVFIEVPQDWECINGGCEKKCRCLLPCGHTCMLACHPFDNEQINCTQKCTKRLSCGHTCSAMCCDPCKCLMCERRNNGTRALIKPGPVHSHVCPAETAQQPEIPARSSDSSSVDQWNNYANGGARADDAEFVRKVQEENFQYLEEVSVMEPAEKLIEVSPTKPAKAKASMNTDLLIDLDVGSNVTAKPRVFKHTLSYATAAAAKKQENQPPVMLNLLD